MTTLIEITEKVNKLNRLLENANKPKILWEEIKIVSDKAFDLQDEIIMDLDKLEKQEKDLIKLQSVFDTREIVWDLMAKIASRELVIKEKTTKNHENAHEKHACGCGHHDDGCCHGHSHDEDNCGCGCDEDDCGCGHGKDECGCGCGHQSGKKKK